MRLLEGKTAIVYGGSGVLGSKIARELHEQGAKTVTHCFHGWERAQKLAEELDPSGKDAMAVQADCGDPQALAGLVEKVRNTFGSVDIVVNAVHPPFEPVDVADSKDGDWKLHLDAMMSGYHIFQTAIPVMREQQFGRLIYISAAMAVRYGAGCSMYTAVKRGMNGFCRTLAIEEAKNNILVNIVAPGGVADAETETGEDWDEMTKEFIAKCALGRFATSKEVANTVVYFASDLAEGITGQTLYVSGGEIML